MLGKGFENKTHQRRARYLKPRKKSRLIPTMGVGVGGGGAQCTKMDLMGESYKSFQFEV